MWVGEYILKKNPFFYQLAFKPVRLARQQLSVQKKKSLPAHHSNVANGEVGVVS